MLFFLTEAKDFMLTLDEKSRDKIIFNINNGTPTEGTNGYVTVFSLPVDIKVWYSGIGFYYPNGEQMQR